ncbi:hypothetical protein [Xanthomonas perforans]|uniref:hypothetical protein n=1 Tax=Xanthomonas perforans TaxID=442694 RepID=UPI001194C261|nr:hypothetical protein [Xanthomonas perforans]MDC9652786.1 hypothetical protein [Xanthomonas perforans]MDC9656889.1 hypothetical protein [Xanthomonas perforans]MDC9677982.1 hypothetical protein [Xanthomonas perforans]MDC9682216.1 hypothetical protein [Xanthomonas perforans]MDC9686435.1 hypothetical protein [Xanthomonas perforans]
MKRMLILGLRCSLLIGLLCAGMPLTASPKCEADTFTGKKGCVYGTGTIGLAGVGNQIITEDGQMHWQRHMQVFGDPIDSILMPLSGDLLKDLAGAQSLIMAVQGKDGHRGGEMAMKKSGKIFKEFLEDIQANEPEVLESSTAEALVLVGTEFQPYASRSTP